MGREVRRVDPKFDWPLKKVWKGFINPFYEYCHQCPECENGYSSEGHRLYQEWWGYIPFDPIAYGSELLTPETPAVKEFSTRNVDRNPNFFIKPPFTREQAIEAESRRLCDHWNGCWNHHLIQADLDAILEDDHAWSFTRIPLKDVPLEEYIRTRAYYLWIEAGCPESDGSEFWNQAAEEHKGHYLPFDNGYRPTLKEWQEYIILSPFGGGSSEAWSCLKARAKREGFDPICSECKGSGRYWEEGYEEKADNWEEIPPPEGEGYQIWETVSEGSPISPVFLNPRELAEWMVANDTSITKDTDADGWERFILGPGWAPSMVGIVGEGLISGVKASI